MAGEITAEAGTIGGFTINTNTISDLNFVLVKVLNLNQTHQHQLLQSKKIVIIR